MFLSLSGICNALCKGISALYISLMYEDYQLAFMQRT